MTNTKWTKEQLKSLSIARYTAHYQGVVITERETELQQSFPGLFTPFEALSVGSGAGQAFLVPLDESSMEVAEFILRALAAYEGD